MLLRLENITAGYGSSIILKDVSLPVGKNDFLGIIGPNGGGKTTLLKVILGLITPFAGSITWDLPPKERIIGYLPQFLPADRAFPIQVEDVVLSGLMTQKRLMRPFSSEARDRACDILQKLGIAELRRVSMNELSGGQMQRVLLGRALISSPRLLVLDEPTTFVDQSFSTSFVDILEELHQKMAIIMVSHDMGSIIRHVENIACVNGSVHYHSKDEFAREMSESTCPVRLVMHGDIPHTVLKRHGDDNA